MNLTIVGIGVPCTASVQSLPPQGTSISSSAASNFPSLALLSHSHSLWMTFMLDNRILLCFPVSYFFAELDLVPPLVLSPS